MAIRFNYQGDRHRAMMMRRDATLQEAELRHQMSFQGLFQGCRRVQYTDGSAIVVQAHGTLSTVTCFAPVAGIQTEVIPVVCGTCWCSFCLTTGTIKKVIGKWYDAGDYGEGFDYADYPDNVTKDEYGVPDADQIKNYTGVRYLVEVCMDSTTGEKQDYICCASDFRRYDYETQPNVLLLFRGIWSDDPVTSKRIITKPLNCDLCTTPAQDKTDGTRRDGPPPDLGEEFRIRESVAEVDGAFMIVPIWVASMMGNDTYGTDLIKRVPMFLDDTYTKELSRSIVVTGTVIECLMDEMYLGATLAVETDLIGRIDYVQVNHFKELPHINESEWEVSLDTNKNITNLLAYEPGDEVVLLCCYTATEQALVDNETYASLCEQPPNNAHVIGFADGAPRLLDHGQFLVFDYFVQYVAPPGYDTNATTLTLPSGAIDLVTSSTFQEFKRYAGTVNRDIMFRAVYDVRTQDWATGLMDDDDNEITSWPIAMYYDDMAYNAYQRSSFITKYGDDIPTYKRMFYDYRRYSPYFSDPPGTVIDFVTTVERSILNISSSRSFLSKVIDHFPVGVSIYGQVGSDFTRGYVLRQMVDPVDREYIDIDYMDGILKTQRVWGPVADSWIMWQVLSRHTIPDDTTPLVDGSSWPDPNVLESVADDSKNVSSEAATYDEYVGTTEISLTEEEDFDTVTDGYDDDGTTSDIRNDWTFRIQEIRASSYFGYWEDTFYSKVWGCFHAGTTHVTLGKYKRYLMPLGIYRTPMFENVSGITYNCLEPTVLSLWFNILNVIKYCAVKDTYNLPPLVTFGSGVPDDHSLSEDGSGTEEFDTNTADGDGATTYEGQTVAQTITVHAALAVDQDLNTNMLGFNPQDLVRNNTFEAQFVTLMENTRDKVVELCQYGAYDAVDTVTMLPIGISDTTHSFTLQMTPYIGLTKQAFSAYFKPKRRIHNE